MKVRTQLGPAEDSRIFLQVEENVFDGMFEHVSIDLEDEIGVGVSTTVIHEVGCFIEQNVQEVLIEDVL